LTNLVAALALPEGEKLPHNLEKKASVAEAVGTHASVLEPKYDGWRMLWIVGDDGVARPYSRSGISYAGSMPAIEGELSQLPPGTALDTEVVAFKKGPNGELRHERGVVASTLGSGTAKSALASGKLTLVVFDLIAHGGVDARSLTHAKRRHYLELLFEKVGFSPRVQLIPTLPATGESHDALIALGYEGSVVKWDDAPYKSGARGAGQFKLKPQATVDAVVMGYKPGTPGSSFDGLVGAIEFGQHDENGVLRKRGRCSGMDWDTRLEISANQDKYLGTVIEVAHMGAQKPTAKNPLGALLSPQFKHFRPDRDPASVTFHDK
jgi:bifunctional non-homologous end joining protein LigD